MTLNVCLHSPFSIQSLRFLKDKIVMFIVPRMRTLSSSADTYSLDDQHDGRLSLRAAGAIWITLSGIGWAAIYLFVERLIA